MRHKMMEEILNYPGKFYFLIYIILLTDTSWNGSSISFNLSEKLYCFHYKYKSLLLKKKNNK